MLEKYGCSIEFWCHYTKFWLPHQFLHYDRSNPTKRGYWVLYRILTATRNLRERFRWYGVRLRLSHKKHILPADWSIVQSKCIDCFSVNLITLQLPLFHCSCFFNFVVIIVVHCVRIVIVCVLSFTVCLYYCSFICVFVQPKCNGESK